MAGRIRHSNSAALRHTQQRESLQVQRIDDGLEIGQPVLEGEWADIAFGESAPARVIADQSVRRRQLVYPMPPQWRTEVMAQIGHPVCGSHEYRSRPREAVGQTRTVVCSHKVDSLINCRFLTCGGPGWVHGNRCRHESVTPLSHGSDVVLRLPVVAQHVSGCFDPGRQRLVATVTLAPQRFQQLGPRHHSLMVPDQVCQEVEHLGLYRDQAAAVMEFIVSPW